MSDRVHFMNARQLIKVTIHTNLTNMKKRHQNNRKKQMKKRPQANVTDGWMVESNTGWKLPRTVTNIVPDRMMTRLRYKGCTTFVVAASTTTISKRWQPTSAYDVDPALGGFTPPGYNELAAFYNGYRVVGSRIVVRFANQSTQPFYVVAIPTAFDPGSSPSSATIHSWPNNPYAKSKLLPATGGPGVSISSSMTSEKMFGTKAVYFGDNYSAAINASPVSNWYWAVGVMSPTSVGSNSTVTVSIDIYIDLSFFDRKNLLD
jgi:hypothetical protein